MPVATGSDTHARLLAGAEKVFAERGLLGATTREIALAAGVNEVTLFRHFHSKQRLLAAVIEHIFSEDDAAVAAPATLPLREMLRRFAESYARRLSRNISLVRVLLGEIQHCDEQERRIVREVFRPQRQELIEALLRAQEAGRLRPEADAPIAADQFAAAIFLEVMRRSLPLPPEYSAERYLAECVETTARGLEKRRPR